MKSRPLQSSIEVTRARICDWLRRRRRRAFLSPLYEGGAGGGSGLEASAIWGCPDAGGNATPPNPPFLRGGKVRNCTRRKSEVLQLPPVMGPPRRCAC
jgi:hypothetical protein